MIFIRGAVDEARETGVYRSVVRGDVIRLDNKFKGKKFDVVFSSQVIEHLSKKSGEIALSSWEKLAKKRIVVSTPFGFTPYERIGTTVKEKNPHQKHLSGWSIEEFKRRGYKVHGQGMNFIYKEKGLARSLPKLVFLWQILSYLLSPIAYFFPDVAFIMVCKKEIDEK